MTRGLLMALALGAAIHADRAQPMAATERGGPLANTSVRTAAHVDTSIASFLLRARAATARYQDRGEATLDGYRPIGTDFPGMGEHWIQIGILFAGRFDASRPAVLEYAAIAGRPTLVGVAYALPLLEGEAAPAFPSSHAWHVHTGSVAEETDLIAQVMSSHASVTGPRLAMLHAWIWMPNPAGMFQSDNWALPFARAGLMAPTADPGPIAGRAMSLVSGGDAFYARLFSDVGNANERDRAAIREALSAARAGSANVALRYRGRAIDAQGLAQLHAVWTRLWVTLDSTLSVAAGARLRPIEDR